MVLINSNFVLSACRDKGRELTKKRWIYVYSVTVILNMHMLIARYQSVQRRSKQIVQLAVFPREGISII